MSDRPDTDPHELPDVDPDAAPAIPGPPLLPTIDREAVTMPPAHDFPTPRVRMRREVVETLARAEQAVNEIKEAHRHSINEPVNVVDALEKLNALSDAKAAARLADHEEEEKADAQALAAKVDAVEKRRAEEHAALSQKIDAIPGVFREEAAKLANPFLVRFDDWRKHEGARIDEHELKITAIDQELQTLKTEFNAAKLNYDRRLAAVEVQLKQLNPKSIDDVTP